MQDSTSTRLRNRREFVQSVLVSLAPAMAANPAAAVTIDESLPPAFLRLAPFGAQVKPIWNDEFRGRLLRAQQLMTEASPRFDALFIAPGTSLYYFTGVHWWPSERLLAFLLPRSGDPIFI